MMSSQAIFSRLTGDIPSTVALTMRRAGVAITVTSLTDFIVFIIGAITVRMLGLSARVCVRQL